MADWPAVLDALRAWWGPVEARSTLPCSPGEVFAVLADPGTYPHWLVGAQRIERVDPDFPRPGASFDHAVGAGGPAVVEDSTDAVAVEPPHYLALDAHVGPARARVEFFVEDAPTGSEIRFREALVGRLALVTPAVRVLLHVRCARSLRRLERFMAAGRGAGPRPTTGSR